MNCHRYIFEDYVLLGVSDDFNFSITAVLFSPEVVFVAGDGTATAKCCFQYYLPLLQLILLSAQVGDGTNIVRNSPVAVVGLGSAAVTLGLGVVRSLATCSSFAAIVFIRVFRIVWLMTYFVFSNDVFHYYRMR
jgi:hypothetical protein